MIRYDHCDRGGCLLEATIAAIRPLGGAAVAAARERQETLRDMATFDSAGVSGEKE